MIFKTGPNTNSITEIASDELYNTSIPCSKIIAMIDQEEKCLRNESAFSQNIWEKLIYMKAKVILFVLQEGNKSPVIK